MVYEHFGGKEGLYAPSSSTGRCRPCWRASPPASNPQPVPGSGSSGSRSPCSTYVEERTDGFRILIRDSPAGITSGTYATLLNDAVNQVASILPGLLPARAGSGHGPAVRAGTGRFGVDDRPWWLDVREPKKEVVAAHVVNVVWNGLTHLEADPQLTDTEGS